ncbi:AraC family transcriptional regulator [Pseudomonas sp. Root68]|uniref:AraC family transcriptional regulator n=1 Tax=unclassified Pseudomonas TaxID=196821 RepID=UPI0006FEC2AE|nr:MULTISPECIES: AraC family transcriptional regulator [unclassified Pseudomonas]KRB03614.1 AraC family transcriptional regulator [Pseudomonas sp. Root68]KRB70986.1 AraC family transcriptional regulator [Pseudomonas sp. Root71]
MLNDVHLLERHSLLSSADYREIKDKVSQYLCPHSFNVLCDEPIHTRLNGVFFGDSALLDLRYGAPVEITIGDIADQYLFRITLQGHCEVAHGRRSAAMQSGYLSVSSPFAQSRIVTDGECRNLILRVDRDALETQLQRLLGRSLRQSVIFDVSVDHLGVGVVSLYHTLDYICRLYGSGVDGSRLASGLSEYLMQLLLTQLPHNYSADLLIDSRAPLPHHVKKARDYIEEHLDEPISLTTLSELCGVSVRTLQNGFNQFLQQAPVEYIRDRRLAVIHESLKQGRAGETVTDILLRHGINSFGHFSSAYRQRYGCLPSDTLRRRKH